MKYLLSPLFVAAALLAAGTPASAQVSPAATPAAKVNEGASPAPSPSASATPVPKPFTTAVYADAGYVSASAAGPTNAITGRVFDTLNKQPQFHNLNFQATQTGTVGGKVEFSFGDDADVINSYPKQGTLSQIDITQAYLSLAAGKFSLIGGKFATLAGAEVIESPSDLNFSRSILFGYAIPFTHTGARLTYTATPQVSLIFGLNKGWDVTKTISSNGDNTKLTAEYGAAWNPSKAFSLTAQGYSGTVENFDPAGNQRRALVDLVGTYHLNDNVQFVLNYDSASQTNTPLLNGSGAVATANGTATWNGLAGYASTALGSKFSATLRAEYFNDNHGARTGLAQRWNEGTLTFGYAPNPNLIFRLEGRNDRSNRGYFAKRDGSFQNSMNSIGFEAILKAP